MAYITRYQDPSASEIVSNVCCHNDVTLVKSDTISEKKRAELESQ